jgi:phosphatidate cytidylyltransferase
MALTSFYAIGLATLAISLVASAVMRNREVVKRSLTLLVLLHILCLVIRAGPVAFAALAGLIVAAGAFELTRCSGAGAAGSALAACVGVALFVALKAFPSALYAMLLPYCVILAFLFIVRIEAGRRRRTLAWIFLLGFVVPCAAALSEIFDRGYAHAIALLLFVQFNDGIAYVGGKRLGRVKPKFLNAISPNKTVEGYAAGAFGIVAAALLLHTAIPAYPIQGMPARIAALAPLVFLFANAGDLAFSSVKRRLGVKDFSNLLAGHGGVLDRFDSILCLSPAYLVLLLGGFA